MYLIIIDFSIISLLDIIIVYHISNILLHIIDLILKSIFNNTHFSVKADNCIIMLFIYKNLPEILSYLNN